MFFHCHQAVIMLTTQELLIMLAIQEFSTGVKWALKEPEAPLLDLFLCTRERLGARYIGCLV